MKIEKNKKKEKKERRENRSLFSSSPLPFSPSLSLSLSLFLSLCSSSAFSSFSLTLFSLRSSLRSEYSLSPSLSRWKFSITKRGVWRKILLFLSPHSLLLSPLSSWPARLSLSLPLSPAISLSHDGFLFRRTTNISSYFLFFFSFFSLLPFLLSFSSPHTRAHVRERGRFLLPFSTFSLSSHLLVTEIAFVVRRGEFLPSLKLSFSHVILFLHFFRAPLFLSSFW